MTRSFIEAPVSCQVQQCYRRLLTFKTCQNITKSDFYLMLCALFLPLLPLIVFQIGKRAISIQEHVAFTRMRCLETEEVVQDSRHHVLPTAKLGRPALETSQHGAAAG